MPTRIAPTTSRLHQALRDGPPGAAEIIDQPADLERLVAAIAPLLGRRPRLAHLYLADPQRFLRALGFRLDGAALRRFEAQLAEDGWQPAPEKYEAILDGREPIARGLKLDVAALDAPAIADDVEPDERPDRRGRSNRPDRPGRRGRPRDAREARARVVGSPAGTSGDTLDRLSLVESALRPATGTHNRPLVVPTVPAPPPPSTAPHSHSAAVNYAGRVGAWDVVIQLHSSVLQQSYDAFFALQALGSGIGQLGNEKDTEFVDTKYTFEGWLFFFIQLKMQFEPLNTAFTMTLAPDDTVGVTMRVNATSATRWTPSADWEETADFSATITRWGALTRQSSVLMGDQEVKRVYAADLANGWTDITLDGDPDPGLEDLLGIALDAYFADELPLLPVTPTFKKQEPFISWPRARGFSHALAPDRDAVSLCFHEDPDGRAPFRDYILDHDRNFALGISDSALEAEIADELPDLPMKENGVTLEEIDVDLKDGHIEVEARGFTKVIFKIPLSYKADIELSLKNGALEAELTKSSLNLPWWLWVFSGVFLAIPGLILTSIANVVGNVVARNLIEDTLDLDSLFDDLAGDTLGSSDSTITIERLEQNSDGLFLKGNVSLIPS